MHCRPGCGPHKHVQHAQAEAAASVRPLADLARAAPCSPRSARVSAQATSPAAHACPLHMSLLASWKSLLAAAMLPCRSGAEGEKVRVQGDELCSTETLEAGACWCMQLSSQYKPGRQADESTA